MRFKTGQIFLVDWTGGILGKLIKFYNLIKYGKKGFTHAAIIGKVFKDDMIVYEALSNGFSSSTYSKEGIQWFLNNGRGKLLESKIPLKNLSKNLEKYKGRKYAWRDLISIALSIFKIPTCVTGANKLICSEAVSRVLYDSSNKKLNLQEEFNKRYDLITPMDLYNSKYLRHI